jgi:hypothetical protein
MTERERERGGKEKEFTAKERKKEINFRESL